MRKLIFTILFSIFSLTRCYAQTTAITATVVDSDSTTWASGTWSIAFSPGPNAPDPSQYKVSGATLVNSVLYQSGSMNSSGVLTITIYDSSLIGPTGSSWNLKVCPNASAGCYVYNFTSLGATQNISTALTAVLPGPRFRAVSGAFGYNNTEASLSLVPGSSYYDVTLGCPKSYSGTTWACITGTGGPPTGAAGGALTGTYPNPTLVTAYLPLTGGTVTGTVTWSATGGTFTITPTSNRITFATTGSFTSVFSSAANAYWDAAAGFNNFIGTQNAGQLIQIGTASGSNTIVGTIHYGGTVPTASVGTIETHSTNQAGSISALSAATTTTITFANSGWSNVAYCTGSPSVSLAAAPYVSAISKTAVTFTFPSLTGSLYYNCAGN